MRQLLSVAAVMVLAFMSMTAFAQSSIISTSGGRVTVSDSGSFEVQLCEAANFGSVNVGSSTGATSNDRTKICYYDTGAFRPGFTVTLKATDFISVTEGVTASFPASQLKIRSVTSPIRTVHPAGQVVPSLNSNVGMIYATGPGSVPLPAQLAGNPASIIWSSNNLATAQTVGKADAGSGMSANVEGASATVQAPVNLTLDIPAAQRPATYQSQITLTLTFTAP